MFPNIGHQQTEHDAITIQQVIHAMPKGKNMIYRFLFFWYWNHLDLRLLQRDGPHWLLWDLIAEGTGYQLCGRVVVSEKVSQLYAKNTEEKHVQHVQTCASQSSLWQFCCSIQLELIWRAPQPMCATIHMQFWPHARHHSSSLALASLYCCCHLNPAAQSRKFIYEFGCQRKSVEEEG